MRLVKDDTELNAHLLKGSLKVKVGDKLRVTTPDDRAEVFTVRGLFDVGNKDANERWVFVPLRSAQTLLDLSGGVSSIEVKVADIFEAETIAQQLMARTGLEADSWMKVNTQLLVGLRSQSASSDLRSEGFPKAASLRLMAPMSRPILMPILVQFHLKAPQVQAKQT